MNFSELNEVFSPLHRQLVESMEDGVFVLDRQGRLSLGNPAGFAMVGWTEKELVGKSVETILDPPGRVGADDRAKACPIRQSLRDGRKREVEDGSFFGKNGRRFPVNYICAPLRADRGASVGAVVSFRQISRRYWLRQLAEAMPNMTWLASPTGTVYYLNGRFLDYTGMGDEEALESWESVIHPDEVAGFLKGWREAVEKETPFERECRGRGRDGEYRWFRVQTVPVRTPDGRLLKWFGLAIDVHRTKSLEEQARQLAHRWTTILAGVTDGVLFLDREWRITYLNGAAEALLERRRDDVQGRNVWEEFPTAVDQAFFREYHRAVRERVTVSFEEFEPALDKWFDVKAYPSQDGLAVYFQDVTERRRTMEALKASEERFRMLSKATSDVIWDLDLSTGAIWWSEGFDRIFGYVDGEAPTLDSWANRIHPQERAEVVASLERAIEGNGKEWSREYRFMRKDGSYVHVADRCNLFRDETGQVIRMVGGATDITERRQYEEKLREQAAFLDKAQDAIIVRELDSRIRYWNKSAENLYGWRATQVIGRSVKTLLYRDFGRFVEATQRVLDEGEWAGELEQKTKDGRTVLVEGRWTLIRDDDGRPASILAINTDITRRKNLEAQILRTQRIESIGALAGGIAHDLNNILSPVSIGVDLLRQGETDEGRLKLLSLIQGSAQRGVDLVGQILAFSRGSEGQRRVVNPANILRGVEQFVRDTFPKTIDLEIDCDPDLWAVNADPTQMDQVLMNLCVNARDVMPNGGTLQVAVKNEVIDEAYPGLNPDARPGPYVCIRVVDAGPGIPSEIQEKIFEPFFTTKASGKGTGLGLSTVLTIVKSHGGFVNVYSEKGKGAAFKVYLPALANERAGEVTHTARVSLPRGNGERILVVDDEQVIREMTCKLLERFNYRTIAAANGAEALALYATQMDTVAAVLTDMAMPVMDGPSTVIALRAMNPSVKIIGASGLGPYGGGLSAIGAEVAGFLSKPYAAESLLKTLHKVIHGEESQR